MPELVAPNFIRQWELTTLALYEIYPVTENLNPNLIFSTGHKQRASKAQENLIVQLC